MNKINAKNTIKYDPINIKYIRLNDFPYQVFGEDFALEYCKKKLEKLKSDIKNKELYISIQNGLYNDKNSSFFFIYLCVEYEDKIYHKISEKILINEKDQDIFNLCKENYNINFEDLIEQKYGYPKNKWIEYYSDVDINNVFYEIMENFINNLNI
jgi:hypothetical protein